MGASDVRLSTPTPWASDGPHIERQLVGTLLVGEPYSDTGTNPLWIAATSELGYRDIYTTELRAIWRSMAAVHAAGDEIDVVTVHLELLRCGDLKAAGGAVALGDLTGLVISSVSLPSLVRAVLEWSRRRQIAAVASDVMHSPGSGDFNSTLEAAAEKLKTLEMLGGRSISTHLGRGACEHALGLEQPPSDEDTPSAFFTGFPSLDEITLGFHPGSFTVIAGRPKMGKTAWALNSLVAGARAGIPQLFASCETAEEPLYDRLLSAVARVPLMAIRAQSLNDAQLQAIGGRRLNDAELSEIGKAGAELALLPIHVICRTSLSLGELRDEVRMFRGDDGLTVWVDYLQLMSSGGRWSSRQEEVSAVARGLHAIGVDDNVAMVALAQLNRDFNQRADKRPVEGDLRESGEIEMAADVILAIFRPVVYDPTADRRAAEMIVIKQKQGPEATAHMDFDAACVLFSDVRAIS